MALSERSSGRTVRRSRPAKWAPVLIRGPNLFREYWHISPTPRGRLSPPAGSERATLGDPGRTGTFSTLVGRKHDLIITSGYNVYPQVVERVLGECPGVGECASCWASPTPSDEVVAAAVVRSEPNLDEAQLKAWWSERLVHYQQPRTNSSSSSTHSPAIAWAKFSGGN